MIDSVCCIINMLWGIDLSLTLFNSFWNIYSIPKESKYTAKIFFINNETQCVFLLFLSSRFIAYAPSFILGKLFFEKTLLNLGP